MRVFFTSDTHFGHGLVLSPDATNRPWDTVEDMDQALIERWNESVGPKDHVYHLGDFAFHKRERTREILFELNGTLHMLAGNHDSPNAEPFQQRCRWVKRYHEFSLGAYDSSLRKHKLVLCHFPFESWNKNHYGSFHAHGHCHGTLRQVPNRIDVGVDALNNGYRPIELNDLFQRFMESRELET
jgi:calcineurin-like phosphoesterase family protein